MIARKSVLIFYVASFGYLLGFIALILVARYLGPIPLGIIGFGSGFVGLFSFLTYLGYDIAHLKRVSEGKNLDKCIGTYLIVKVILAGVTIVVVISAIFIWKLIFHGEFESSTHEIVIYILLISTVITNLANIMLSTFAARKETAKQQIPLFFGHVVQALSIIFVAVMSLSVFMFAGAYVLGAITTFILALLLFRGYPIGKPNRKYLKSYNTFAIPILFGVMGGIILTNFDKVMIQLFLGTQEVGYYFTVVNLIIFMMFMGGGLSTILIPTISTHSTNGNFKKIREIVFLAERYVSIIITPVLALTFLFSETIIFILLGNTFTSAYLVLSIFSVVMWIKITVVPSASQISGLDKPGIIGKTYVLMAVLNIILNILFIPKNLMGINLLDLGIEGAALATLISYLVQLIVFRVVVYKLTKAKPNPRIFLHLFAAGMMCTLLYFISKMIPINEVFWFFGFALTGIGIYFGLLFLMREFTKDDFKYFCKMLSLKGMTEYIRKEI